MSFVISKLAWLVLQPSNLLLGLLLLFTLLRRRRLSLALLALLVLAGTLPVGLWLLQPLEERFARPAAPPPDVAGIIVLGGAQESSVTAGRGVLAVNEAAERLIEGLALAYRHPEARLVFSGGSGALFSGDIKERPVNEQFLALLQVDEKRVIQEDRSRNTWENALFTRDLVAPEPDETWLLVTSAAHLPRAVGIFRRIGWPVVPWPVDYRTTGDERFRRVEASQRLRELDEAAREWLGLLAYRLMGRTDAVFPAP